MHAVWAAWCWFLRRLGDWLAGPEEPSDDWHPEDEQRCLDCSHFGERRLGHGDRSAGWTHACIACGALYLNFDLVRDSAS